MPATARGFPYPAYTDSPDVPRDIKALSDFLDANMPIPGRLPNYANAAALPTGVPAGTLVWQTDIARVMLYDGTGWSYQRGFYSMAAGQVSLGALSGNAGVSIAVTFPVGRFTQTPMTTALASNNGYTATSAASLSTAGFSVKVWNPTGSVQSVGAVQWQAVQMTAASGAG